MPQQFVVSVPDYIARTERGKLEWLHHRLRSGGYQLDAGLTVELPHSDHNVRIEVATPATVP